MAKDDDEKFGWLPHPSSGIHTSCFGPDDPASKATSSEEKNTAIKVAEDRKSAVESAYDYLENFDILETITNVGNDEVFTPRRTCERILDALPDEVWHNPNYRWLNPATKNGIFEREIALRLDKGLKDVIPDEETRRKHILQKMIFAIGQTKFTSYVARRTLYYCMDANRKRDLESEKKGKYYGYAIGNGTWFNTKEGNVLTPKENHDFEESERCRYCRLPSTSKYLDSGQREQYAYEFIHHCAENGDLLRYLQDVFFKGDRNMKFDIIIGNPPYQLSDGGSGASARPIYQIFINNAKALRPKYLSMIIPARWYAGGKGLDQFRADMLQDRRIKLLVDFPNAKVCFPNCSIGGGVCYFLWERDNVGDCQFVSYADPNHPTSSMRRLDEYDILVRYEKALSIIEKITKFPGFKSLSSIVSTRNPFGFPSSERGAEKPYSGSCRLFSSDGISYIDESRVAEDNPFFRSNKLMISTLTAEHANESDAEGKYKILSTMKVLNPSDTCTDSYIVVGPFATKEETVNCMTYLGSKFVRFLLMMRISSIHVTRENFAFVPILDFSKNYSDSNLQKMFGLTSDEVAFVDSLIKEY